MSVAQTISAIKERMEAVLPNMLLLQNLPNFDHYVVGYPSNQDSSFLCVRFAGCSDKEADSFSFILHISLPHTPELTAYTYMDEIIGCLETDFEPSAYGYMAGSYAVDMVDDFGRGVIEAFFAVTLTAPPDDCGGRDD
jgi:hypothetical protein